MKELLFVQWGNFEVLRFHTLKKNMYGGKRELANVGLKMEDKRDLVILTPCPSPQTATEPTPHTCVIKNIEALWWRSNSSVEMKMFMHRSLKKTAEGN